MSTLRKIVKVERPRPLKIGGGTQPELGQDSLICLIETVIKKLSSESTIDLDTQELVTGHLKTLAANLRISGAQLETTHQDLMENLNQSLLNTCKLESWPLLSRVYMLELIEIRSLNWSPSESVTSYYNNYRQQLAQNQQRGAQTAPVQISTNQKPVFPVSTNQKPVLPVSTNQKPVFHETINQNPVSHETTNPVTPSDPFTDADQSKASISPNASKLANHSPGIFGLANQSPEKMGKVNNEDELNQNEFGDQSTKKKVSMTLRVQDGEIVLSGTSEELIKTAKTVLTEFFNITNDNFDPVPDGNESDDEAGIQLVPPQISYGKEELMAMARSPICRQTPQQWPDIAKELPGLVRRQGPTSKLILREMEELRKQEEAKNV